MKKISFLLLVFTCSLYAQDNQSNWRFVVRENGVSVYERPVIGSQYREVKGVVDVQASVDALLYLFWEDIDSFPEWFYKFKNIRLLKEESSVKYVHFILSTGWPIADRDNVLKTWMHIEADGTIEIFLEGMPQFIPKEPDCVRVAKMTGSIRFTPQKEGTVTVAFTLFMEPGGVLPSVFANAFSIDFPRKTLANMKEMLQKPKYIHVKHHFLAH